MISRKDLEELEEKIGAIASAKYDGPAGWGTIELCEGDFTVTYEIDSHCGCCPNEFDSVDVTYEELQMDLDEVVKKYEDEKLKAKELVRKKQLEKKLKEEKAKEDRELKEFNRLQKKFNK